MKVIIEITNHEEAVAAQNMLSAYLGTGAPKTVAKTEEKKVPVTRAKDEVKKDDTTKRKPKPAKPVEEPAKPVEEPTEGEIDQAGLTAIAKAAVAKTDRGTVKDVISAYGTKISEVAPEDYAALAEELKAL